MSSGRIFSGILAGTLLGAVGFAMLHPAPVLASSALPKTLDLAGVTWRIDEVDFPNDAIGILGYTHCDSHRIELKKGLDGERETLLHEILHSYVCVGPEAIDNMYYNSKSDKEHAGFDAISEVYADAFRRNPQLARYISAGGL